MYMQARYYDPVIGRFYSNDPVGFSNVHNFNRYAYANNNPYKYVDPDGRDYTETYISLKVPFVGSVDVGTVNFTPNANGQGNTTSGAFIRFGTSASNVENGGSKGALKQEPTIKTKGAIAGLTLGKGAGSHTDANFDDPSASLDVGAAVATVSIGDFSGTESSAAVEIGPSIGADTTVSKSFTLTGNDVKQAALQVTEKVKEFIE